MGVTDRSRGTVQFGAGFHLLPDDETMTPRPAHSHHLTLHRFAVRPAGRFVLRLYLQWVIASFLILGTISVAAVAL
tara:strand:- start:27893 stop:28120 length:228 start_codon:yes stop_codon:yes gene_type:complete